ncbi:MAG: hypothetical protein FIB01_15530 [Gemmatimonadetes bacterium]|nr:hypothetical protein [Gemmatimonadota bacterium]
MLTTLGLTPSFGFGDRLGRATPGHIAAVRGSGYAPVFAQQSVRENARTGRSPQQVIDDARRAVDAAGWHEPWGADADHLKTAADLPAFVAAGYTFFTVDPGEHVDNAADTDPLPALREKARVRDWDELAARYLADPGGEAAWGRFDEEQLLRAQAKYGRAIAHAVAMHGALSELKDEFDFEVSVDETDAPTTPLEHYFIASELTRAGVRFTSLAPRFIGRFEKGVDYIGDLAALDAELARHAAVTGHFGTYKLSLHSGSDKFSVYPLIVRHWGARIHVKTAGTSYLEALRTLAVLEPGLFRRILELGRERYATDRATYHVSASVEKIPAVVRDADLPGLLDDFDAREVLHVTYGSALGRYGPELHLALGRHAAAYHANLQRHLGHHLALLK